MRFLDKARADPGLAILAGAGAAVLLLGLAYAFVAVPGLDDLCHATAHGSPLAVANEMWWTWSGRWLGILVLTAIAQSFDLMSWQYGALVAFSFAIWLGGFYAIAATMLDRRRFPAAMLMLAVFWTAAPSPTEAFYWLTGVVIYAPAFSLGCVAVLLLVRGSRWAALPALAAPLFSELAGIVLVAGLLPFIRRKHVWPVVAAALAGTLAVILSPGNAARAELNRDISAARLLFYVVRPYDTPWALMADARLLAMVALLAALPKPERAVPWKPLLAALFAILVATVAATFGHKLAPEWRVLDFLFAVTIAAAFVLGLSLRLNARVTIMAGVMALTLLASPAVRMIFHDPLPVFQPTPCPYAINR